MTHKIFIKDVSLIGIAQILVSLSGFFLLPIITKTLGPEDYGIWSQIIVTVSLLAPFALLGLTTTTVRFLSAEKDIFVIRDDFYSVITFIAFTGFSISLFVFLASDWLAELILSDSGSAKFVRIGAWLILLSALSRISTLYFRIFHQIKIYVIFQISQSFGQLVLIYVFLSLGYGLLGVVTSALLTQGILAIASIALVVHQIGFSFPKFTRFKDYIRFGIPLSLNPMLRWITESSDRYLIGYFLSATGVGLYSAPYAIGNLIQMLVMPIQVALFPELSRLYDEGKIDDVKTYFSYSLKFFLVIAIPAAFGLAALAKPIILILTTPEFLPGTLIIPLIAFTGILVGMFQIFVNITLLFKKTYYNFFLFIVPGFVNICLNIILIPVIGILGAALATFISYLVMFLFCIVVTRRFFRFSVDFLSFIKMLISALVMYLVVLIIAPSTVLELGMSILAGAGVYLILLFISRVFNEKEIRLIKRLINRK